MTSVKLYGYCTSPYVRKTGCFLFYKEINFTHIPVNPSDPAETIGFTNGTQVPVLEINGEWKLESSDHAYWLDELFPEKPLCPKDHADKISEIDNWVSNTFLVSIFRFAIDAEMNLDFMFRSWRLAALVSSQTPLSEEIRHMWPLGLRHAPFIQDMAKHMDLTESYEDMQVRIGLELAAHIGDGPFMGGFQEPTMLDLAVFPQVIFGYMFGLEERLSSAEHPVIKAWMQRVAKHLPQNPTLAPNWMQLNALTDALN